MIRNQGEIKAPTAKRSVVLSGIQQPRTQEYSRLSAQQFRCRPVTNVDERLFANHDTVLLAGGERQKDETLTLPFGFRK
jgi:hypothetical protein